LRIQSFEHFFFKDFKIMAKLFYKPEIREKMQRRRKGLGLVPMTQAAQAVAAQTVLINEFLNAEHIGCYLSIEGELDPMPLMNCAQTLNKKLYLPVMSHSTEVMDKPAILEFHAYTVGDPLLKGLHGISGPAHRSSLMREVGSLDLIFLPLVAFDENCNRLGRGAGHYDRTLNHVKEKHGRLPFLIGLAYEFQKIPEIIPDKWDVPLNMVITENTVYYSPK
jgi:5-formyltetrahydrofolate cyclo-ligase